MASTNPWCFLCIDDTVNCSICGTLLVKNGKTLAGKQRFLCRVCNASGCSEDLFLELIAQKCETGFAF